MPSSTLPPCIGFSALENLLSETDYLYVLRSLYNLVLASQRRGESLNKLQRRIEQFERDCDLPLCLSVLPMQQFLQDLEELQYLYPLYSREVNFILNLKK